MNLPKAKELQKEAYQSLADHKFYDHADAVKVGLEATDRLIELRNNPRLDPKKLLPSETNG